MKTLVVYYSRTGNTDRVARDIASKLGADIERIYDTKKRGGIWGWIVGGKEGTFKKMTVIEGTRYNPAEYDLVVIGTPIWVNSPPATRTYLTKFQGKFKRVAFFCTMGGSGFENLFSEMESLCGISPVATVAITDKQIQDNTFSTSIESFISKVIS